MINLIQGSAASIHKAHGGQSINAGMLITPFAQYTLDHSLVWAMDNGCFTEYNPIGILRLLAKYQPHADKCLWVTLPDIVQDHHATLTLSMAWLGTYQRFGYKSAFVLQNGATLKDVPYDSVQALFIGGDNDFKYSDVCKTIISEGKRRGLWIHAGRVNTIKRIKYCGAIGCDSFDGTTYSMFRDTYVKKHLPYYQHKQKGLL